MNVSPTMHITWKEIGALGNVSKSDQRCSYLENDVSSLSRFRYENEFSETENVCDTEPDHDYVFDASMVVDKIENELDCAKRMLWGIQKVPNTVVPDHKATLNPASKKIFDEQSLLSAFCSNMSKIWDVGADRHNLPDPVSAPKRPGEFSASPIELDNLIWHKVENLYTDLYECGPFPPCFGYDFPISLNTEETHLQINNTEESACVEFDKTCFKDDDYSENFKTYERLEDFSEEMKNVVEDICCMTKEFEDSIPGSAQEDLSDEGIFIDIDRMEIPKNVVDASTDEHPLLLQDFDDSNETEDTSAELPPIPYYPIPQYYHAFGFPLSGFCGFGSTPTYPFSNPSSEVHRPYQQSLRFLPVPCSIWCDNDMEAHVNAFHSHELCEKRHCKSSQNTSEIPNLSNLLTEHNDLCCSVKTSDESPEDNLDTFLWLQDESNTAYATVFPENTRDTREEQLPEGNSDGKVYDKTEIFLSSLYLPEQVLLPMGISVIPEEEIRKYHCSKCLKGSNCNCNSSSGRSSGYSSDGVSANGENSLQSNTQVDCVESQNLGTKDILEYDNKYSAWIPLPDARRKVADSSKGGDFRHLHVKRNKSSKPYHSKHFPAVRNQCQTRFSKFSRPILAT